MKPIENIFGFDCVTCEHNRHCYGGNMGNQFRYCEKSAEKIQNLDNLEQENKELNEDARTKQDLLYECNSLESRLSNEIVKNEHLEQQCKKQEDLIIRKLTPKEYWRLMGFDDSDFEKAAKVNSNTQLYKQAGNSIVVNVLCEIFKQLLQFWLGGINE